MSRLLGIVTAVSVILLSMAFAAMNSGNLVRLNLGLVTLYRAPVALVAFGGLFVGMVVMFATGVHSDLKVRRILRERLAEESREEQKWFDRNQQDLFEDQGGLPARTQSSAPSDASDNEGGTPGSLPAPSEPSEGDQIEPESSEADPPAFTKEG